MAQVESLSRQPTIVEQPLVIHDEVAVANGYVLRAISAHDLEGLVDLHLATYGARDNANEDIRVHHEKLLAHVLRDSRPGSPAMSSRVITRNGVLVGMVYGAHQPMRMRDRHVWSTTNTMLAVHPDHRNQHTTDALMRNAFENDAFLVMADRCNRAGRRAGERATTARLHPQYSLRWARIINPFTGVAAAALNRTKRHASRLTHALHQAANMADNAMASHMPGFIAVDSSRPPQHLAASELTATDLADHGDALLRQFVVRPDVTSAALTNEGWARFRRLRPEGDFIRVGVWNDHAQLVGWYLLHVLQTGTAEVLQLVGLDQAIDGVIRLLLLDARDRGVGSLHGTASPTMVVPLSEAGAFFHGRGSEILVRTGAEVHSAFQSSRVMVTGFEGEYPMMLPAGNAFA